ncbi:hypothetical protein CKAH01_08452 [Colletotrichum kahawae]|uniref:Uncharacterized protein n=1 Tax=Colletotrichum kahawae TaxID=34407 RepID=A0AAD9Y166_COLKA|nr:hypothetical protein CKAH01_08452 [Colletotrichum kahawae]
MTKNCFARPAEACTSATEIATPEEIFSKNLNSARNDLYDSTTASRYREARFPTMSWDEDGYEALKIGDFPRKLVWLFCGGYRCQWLMFASTAAILTRSGR